MRGYSEDLRKRIVEAVAEGASSRAVATRFKVSWTSVKRYVKQYREQGHLRERPKPGRPAKLVKEDYEQLRAQVSASPDATIEEQRQKLVAATGKQISWTTLQRALVKLAITRKKELSKS